MAPLPTSFHFGEPLNKKLYATSFFWRSHHGTIRLSMCAPRLVKSIATPYAAQYSEAKSYSLGRCSFPSILDRLFAVLYDVAVGPAKTWYIVFSPLADVIAAFADFEVADVTFPLAARIFVFFARQNAARAFLAFVLLASSLSAH